MKTTKEMIEVMQAYADGKKIESTYRDKWEDCENPCWNWNNIDYRIKPEQTTRPMTLDEIIEWRKNSNGVILWNGYLSEVGQIKIKYDKFDQIYTVAGGWVCLEDFIKFARKPYGEKFEVEL